MSDLVTACPECDTSQILERKWHWYCQECGAQFDQPRERESRVGRQPNCGTAAVLASIGEKND